MGNISPLTYTTLSDSILIYGKLQYSWNDGPFMAHSPVPRPRWRRHDRPYITSCLHANFGPCM